MCGGKIKLWEKFSGICQVNPKKNKEEKKATCGFFSRCQLRELWHKI